MQLLIEAGEVVLEGPLLDLALVTVRVTVVVGPIAVAFMQPPLIIALQLVVEDNPVDPCPTLVQALGFALVGAIDLDVVLKFSLTSDARVEGLAPLSVAVRVAVMVEQAPSLLREGDGDVARTRHADRFDQALLTEVSEIARARIRWRFVVIAQITTGDHPKRADRRERSRLGPTHRVLAIAIADDLSLQTAWQVDIVREHVSRIDVALAGVPIPLVPARAISGIVAPLVSGRLPRIAAGPSTKLACVVVLVARTDVRLPRVVISIVVMGAPRPPRSKSKRSSSRGSESRGSKSMSVPPCLQGPALWNVAIQPASTVRPGLLY